MSKPHRKDKQGAHSTEFGALVPVFEKLATWLKNETKIT